MLKFLSLLISFVLIASGVLSCTTSGLVENRKKMINAQVVNTVNQNGDDRQVLPQLEEEHMVNQTLNQVGLAHLTLGIDYTGRGLIDQAICEFQSVIETNPHHLESHVRLGTNYGLKGMANEALSEFMKAMDINLNEAVAKIVLYALPPRTANQKAKTDIVKARINLRDAYEKDAALKKTQIVFEKALAPKPELTITKESLSEVYFSVGTSLLENQKYDSAIVEFNKVLETNPDFPQIKDVLGNTHYNLGMIYAENGKLDKAMIEFNKAMEISRNYAMQDNSNLNIINKDKMAISSNRIRHDINRSNKNTNNSTKSGITEGRLHEEEKDSIKDQIEFTGEIILAENSDTKDSERDQHQAEIKHPIISTKGNNEKLAQSNKVPFEAGQLQEANASIHEKAQPITGISDEDQGKKQIHEAIAHAKSVNTGETNIDDLVLVDQERKTFSEGKDAENSNYSVYTYSISRNYKTPLGVNEAIKKYENATINNPYNNNAFLNLAYAYYRKAMYLDDAIAMRKDIPEGPQNFSVKRFYLSKTELTANTFDNAIVLHNRPGKMDEEMFREDIVKYKNAFRINPNASNPLYSLAFSFYTKGSSLGIALNSKNNPKKLLFSY